MKIAVAQIRSVPGAVEANRAAGVAAIEDAAAQGAALVVLPELAACGYLPGPDVLTAAEPGDGSGPVLAAWVRAAAACRIAVVGGFAERDGARVYNSAVVVDSGGRLVGRYRKLHLFGAEHGVFDPGDLGLPVFAIDGTAVGVLICYDLRFPEAARILALDGAQVVAVPTAWVGGFDRTGDGSRVGQVEAALVQANLNQVFLACADTVGSAGPHRFLGRSLVVDPYGEPVLGPLPPDEEMVRTAEVDLADVRRAQDRGAGISPRANRRTDVYGARLGYRQEGIRG